MGKRSIKERADDLHESQQEILDSIEARIGPIYGAKYRQIVKLTAYSVSTCLWSSRQIADDVLVASLTYASECTIICGCYQVAELMGLMEHSPFSERMGDEFTNDVKAIVKKSTMRVTSDELEADNDDQN